jgi:signal-transduction protein with cAMP-binding, CBS, and nucleotidyltransferase domain
MLCGMQEIARLLAAHSPFDGLPPEVLEQTAATVEIAFFPAAPASCGRAASRAAICM